MEIGIASGQGDQDDGAWACSCSTRSPPSPGATAWSPSGRAVPLPTWRVSPSARSSGSRRNLGTLTRTATVRPFVDFTTLDLVGVVVEPPRKNPRDAVLPPRPVTTPVTPAPTVTVTVTAKPSKKSGG